MLDTASELRVNAVDTAGPLFSGVGSSANLAEGLFNAPVVEAPNNALELIIPELNDVMPGLEPSTQQLERFGEEVAASQDIVEGVWKWLDPPPEASSEQRHAFQAKKLVISSFTDPETNKPALKEQSLTKIATAVLLNLIIAADPEIHNAAPIIRNVSHTIKGQSVEMIPVPRSNEIQLAAQTLAFTEITNRYIGQVVDGEVTYLGSATQPLLESGMKLLGDGVTEFTDGTMQLGQGVGEAVKALPLFLPAPSGT